MRPQKHYVDKCHITLCNPRVVVEMDHGHILKTSGRNMCNRFGNCNRLNKKAFQQGELRSEISKSSLRSFNCREKGVGGILDLPRIEHSL